MQVDLPFKLFLLFIFNSSWLCCSELIYELDFNDKDHKTILRCEDKILAEVHGEIESRSSFLNWEILSFRELSRGSFLTVLALESKNQSCPRIHKFESRLYNGKLLLDKDQETLILKEAMVGYYYAQPFSYYHKEYVLEGSLWKLKRRGCPRLEDLRGLFNLAYYESRDKKRALQSAAYYTLAFEKANQENFKMDSQLRKEIALDWSLQLARSSQIERALKILQDLAPGDDSVSQRASRILKRLQASRKSRK